MVENKKPFSYETILQNSTKNLIGLVDQKLHLVTLGKPRDEIEAIGLSQVVSKLSPIIGNLLEYEVASKLNSLGNIPKNTKWIRQDPGFPDTTLEGFDGLTPGIEIKTWFPLATEITAGLEKLKRIRWWIIPQVIFDKIFSSSCILQPTSFI